jgi:hypothetical protein
MKMEAEMTSRAQRPIACVLGILIPARRQLGVLQ